MRQFGDMILNRLSEERFDRSADARVNQLAAFDQHRVVSDLQRERVLEGVLNIAGGRLLVYKLAKLKAGEHPLKLVVNDSGVRLRTRHDPAQQAERELLSDHREGLQQVFSAAGSRSIRAARIDCTVDGILRLVQRPRQLYSAVAHQRAFVEQHQYGFFHEERVSAGALDDQALEVGDAAVNRYPHLTSAFALATLSLVRERVRIASP